MIVLALLAAIVVEDGTTLRAAPSDRAPLQAELARGDWLEVRGDADGFYQVWDHRRERSGYVRAWRVRTHELGPEQATDLRVIVSFLRDSPGAEALVVGYTALVLKAAAAPRAADYDALGVVADRLARRASSAVAARDSGVANAVDTARAYGVGLEPITGHDGSVRLCYDGEAFRMVLALSRDPVERARAALKLTRDDCVSDDTPVAALRSWNEWRLSILDQADPSSLPDVVAGRLRLRRAVALVAIAHDLARVSDVAAGVNVDEALRQVALVRRDGLLAEDRDEYDATAVRVAALRLVGRPDSPALSPELVRITHRDEGRTCIEIEGEKGAEPARSCTHGIVLAGSLGLSPDRATIVASVQTAPGWTELWVLRRSGGSLTSGFLVPAPDGPALGYVEPAGFSPDGKRLLLARESFVGHALTRSFEVLEVASLRVERRSERCDALSAFRRWSAPGWREGTLALR